MTCFTGKTKINTQTWNELGEGFNNEYRKLTELWEKQYLEHEQNNEKPLMSNKNHKDYILKEQSYVRTDLAGGTRERRKINTNGTKNHFLRWSQTLVKSASMNTDWHQYKPTTGNIHIFGLHESLLRGVIVKSEPFSVANSSTACIDCFEIVPDSVFCFVMLLPACLKRQCILSHSVCRANLLTPFQN